MIVPALAYQRVLVPLDGSDAAEFAIPYAVDLARKHSAELVLLHLELIPLVVGNGGAEPDDGPTQEQSRAQLTALRERLQNEGLRVREHMVESRDIPNAFARFIESERVSVIVSSVQGRTAMLRWLFGPNLEKGLGNLPVPLLLVRPVYHKIVVPLDGSPWSESAIPQAVEIARAHNAELVLLHVYQSPVSSYTDQLALAGQRQMAEQTYDQMYEQLVSLRNRLRHEGVNARVEIIRSPNPAQAIIDYVGDEQGVSMVVMSTHGRTGLSRWLFGSVAQKVIKNLRCPVTLVRPDEI